MQRKSNGKLWKAGKDVWGLCAAWNHATNPGKLMSEAEHKRSQLYARAIKSRMSRLGITYKLDYIELSDGSLWPIRRSA